MDKEYIFEGIVQAQLSSEKRGTKGFGYDPVFVPEGRDLTFAEMDLDEKNKISHRARAFEKLRFFLSSYRDQQKKNQFNCLVYLMKMILYITVLLLLFQSCTVRCQWVHGPIILRYNTAQKILQQAARRYIASTGSSISCLQ